MEPLNVIDDPEKNDKIEKISLFHPLSRRLHVLLLMSIGFFGLVCMRINVGIAMTCMVNSTAVAINQLNSDALIYNDSSSRHIHESDFLLYTDSYLDTSTKSILIGNDIKNKRDKCSSNRNNNDQPIINDYGGTLTWSPNIQGWIFSSAFYGCLIILIPSGYLADTQSPKLLLTIAVLCYITGTALTPILAVRAGWIPLFIDRVIMGMGDGIAIPTINKIIAFWMPNEEKSTAATIYSTGFSLSTIVGVPFFAYLCSTRFGWPAIFYSCAIFGGVWTIFWHFLASKSPHDCKFIGEKEKRYLLSKPELRDGVKSQKLKIPFRSIFTSPAFLSLIGCAFASNIIVVFIHIYLPTFYKEVLFLSPVDNGIFGAIPPICEMIFRFSLSISMDMMKEKKIISPTAAVKICQSISGFSVSILFIAIGYTASCEKPLLTLILLCGITTASSACVCGYITAMLSIAPAFTGIICSSTFAIGMSSRVLTPLIVPFFVKTGTIEEWRPIFLIIAGFSVVSTIVFVIFGSGECQEWAKNPYEKSSTEKEEIKTKNELELGSILTLNMI